MPGRQSHGGFPTKVSKPKPNRKQRGLNAYAIAEQEFPQNAKIKQSRLGASEGENKPGKRFRDDNEDNEENEEATPRKLRKGVVKGRFDELDVDEGSDSEGNEWKLGQVDSDDDSDVDSDAAFGESDEEKFEDFAFSGGSTKGRPNRQSKPLWPVTLDEGDSDDDLGSDSDSDSLGEDAIDLAAMLDATGEEASDVEFDKDKRQDDSSDEDDSDESVASSSDDIFSSINGSDDEDPGKIAVLQDLVANLSQVDSKLQPSLRQRDDGANEYTTPSDFGITAKKKLTLEDLGLPSIKDPHIKKSVKILASESKSNAKSKKLDVPLSRREQSRLDRVAAYHKAKETLARWTDTVKHNRQADHLIFPLPDQDRSSTNNNKILQPAAHSKPFTGLEATIQAIMEESGLSTAPGQDVEGRLMEFEESETNKLTIEEVKLRRDELRQARELMFREEARSKRIKKIKSKSYRKVHRKLREKEHMKEGAAEDADEDGVEAQDRRRAEERMGARHRASKWAKANKITGRAAWDEDARAGITDMARRDEELRKRVEGKINREEGVGESESSESEAYDSEDEDGLVTHLQQKLGKVANPFSTASGPGSKLLNMKFMMKADATRREANDAAVEQLRKELAGEESSEEGEEVGGIVGRRNFGPGVNRKIQTMEKRLLDFEEGDASEANQTHHPAQPTSLVTPGSAVTKAKSRRHLLSSVSSSVPSKDAESAGWSIPVTKDVESQSEKRRQKMIVEEMEDFELNELPSGASKPVKTKANHSRTGHHKTINLDVEMPSEDEASDSEDTRRPFAIQDPVLLARAFGGADVVGEFNTEKADITRNEDEQIVEDSLPGWGSWSGEGLSRKEKKQKNKLRTFSKVAGIVAKDRKDAKLDRVIINEKKMKKNSKYLASTLPHPFETKQQYERSLRLPVGPEWTTKETFQGATKPRLLVKQGVILPMRKPLL